LSWFSFVCLGVLFHTWKLIGGSMKLIGAFMKKEKRVEHDNS
jgi:hypothetical protein